MWMTDKHTIVLTIATLYALRRDDELSEDSVY